MAMLTLEQIAANLARKYATNKGFFELCAPQNYPYTISVNPPTSQYLVKNFSQVRMWQAQFEQSPWRDLLVKEQVNNRVLGEQHILTKLKFPSPLKLESFIFSYNQHKVNSSQLIESWVDFDGPSEVRRGSFSAFYTICQRVALPLHPALQVQSPAFALRLQGVQHFLSKKAQVVAASGYDFLVAMQFVDFLAALPKTPNIYLRQLALPHMHTKFVEKNYALIDQLLACCLPVERQLYFAYPQEQNLLVENENQYSSAQQAETQSQAPSSQQADITSEQQAEKSSSAQQVESQNQNPSSQQANITSELQAEKSSSAQQAESQNQNPSSQQANITSELPPDIQTEAFHEAQTNQQALNLSSANAGLLQEDSLSKNIHILKEHELVENSLAHNAWQRFLMRWGFKLKPELFRLRSLDPCNLCWLDGQQGFMQEQTRQSIMCLELACLQQWQPPKQLKHVIICENEICFLSLPHISHTIAVWGCGYQAITLGRLALLHNVDVIYWGDIDTHGFAILNYLRKVVKESQTTTDSNLHISQSKTPVRSMLMDFKTIERNLDLQVFEKKQCTGNLTELDLSEQQAYQVLLEQSFAQNLRIEQEQIPFDQVLAALHELLPHETISMPQF